MFVRNVLKEVKMSDAIHYMPAYTQLTDTVIHQIMMSSNPQLQKVGKPLYCIFINYLNHIMMQAQQLLRQVEKRKLYEYIVQTQPILDKVDFTEVFII